MNNLKLYGKEYAKAYYKKNRIKLLKQGEERKLFLKTTNPELVKERSTNNCYKWKERHIEKSLLYSAKDSARRRGHEFKITIADIVVPEKCKYLGASLIRNYKRNEGHKDHRVSIDRIDSSKGYIPGNVQVISCMANKIKTNATIEQLREFCKNFLLIHGE